MGPRVLVRQMISRQFRLQAAYVERDAVTNKSMYSVLALAQDVHLGLVLALLNSRLMSWYFLTRSQVGQRDDFPKIVLKELRSLPMPAVTAMSQHCDGLVLELADASLRLQSLVEAREASPSPDAAERADREIQNLDRQIDRGVYELFGLGPEDMSVVGS